MATIIGRQQETELLKTIYRRDEAQLVAVYGRRRVGKTFLIRETFGNELAFYHTGISPVGMKNTNLLALQLQAFGAFFGEIWIFPLGTAQRLVCSIRLSSGIVGTAFLNRETGRVY